MKDRTTLTKSLHTITVVTQVAMYLYRTGATSPNAAMLTNKALTVLGYNAADYEKDDAVIVRCRDAIAKALNAAKSNNK